MKSIHKKKDVSKCKQLHLSKKIFFTRLTEEAVRYKFLRVIHMTKSEIIAIENTRGESLLNCPCRVNDIHCLDICPKYRTTYGHFKPASTSYCKSTNHEWLINAVNAAWFDYDPSIKYDYGDISKMVWYRYRQAIRYVLEEDLRRKREEQFMDLAAKNPQTYCYSLFKPFFHQVIITRKNQSDKEWGKRCFNARMQSEQEIKNSKIKESHNKGALIKFEKWLQDNPDYGNYGTDIAEENVMFSTDKLRTFFFSKIKKYKYKIPYDSMYNILRCLNRQGFGEEYTFFSALPSHLDIDPLRPAKLIVNVTIEWPNVSKDGFPLHSKLGYSTTTNSWSDLEENDLTPSPIKMRVYGILPESTRNYPLTLITTKTKWVSMMFPKQYSEFEYMNNSKSFTLRECRRFPHEAQITNINVHIIDKNMTFDFQGVHKSSKEYSAWVAKVTNNHTTVPRYYYDTAMKRTNTNGEGESKVDNMLKQVRATNPAKAAAAREAGLKKKREASIKNIPVLETIERLKERGAITDDEYKQLKATLMN